MQVRTRMRRCVWATLLLWCMGAGMAMAQKNVDKMMVDLEKRDDVAINSVIRRNPSTRKIERVVKTFTLKDEKIGRQLIQAFEKDEEYAVTAIKDMPKGRGNTQKANLTLIYQSSEEKRTYTLNITSSGQVTMTVIIAPISEKRRQEDLSEFRLSGSDEWIQLGEQMAVLQESLREMPEIQIPEINIPEIQIPEIQIPEVNLSVIEIEKNEE